MSSRSRGRPHASNGNTRYLELPQAFLGSLAKAGALTSESCERIFLAHRTVDVTVRYDEVAFNDENVRPVENLLSSVTNRISDGPIPTMRKRPAKQ